MPLPLLTSPMRARGYSTPIMKSTKVQTLPIYRTSYRAPNLDLHSHYWWLHSLKISCDSAARLWRLRLFQDTSSIPRYRKRLPTPKVNRLRSPKLRLRQPLFVATLAQTFMRLRCRVMEKRHQNVLPHNSVCDDLYHVCTLAWGKICALFTPHWKVQQR